MINTKPTYCLLEILHHQVKSEGGGKDHCATTSKQECLYNIQNRVFNVICNQSFSQKQKLLECVQSYVDNLAHVFRYTNVIPCKEYKKHKYQGKTIENQC